MRLRILNRDDEMLRRGRAVQRHGYETGVETAVEGLAGGAEVGFDDGMVLWICHGMLVGWLIMIINNSDGIGGFLGEGGRSIRYKS